MISATKQEYFLLFDRNQWSQGDRECIGILQLPIVVGGITDEEGVEYEVEHPGNVKMTANAASVCYMASTSDTYFTFKFSWKGNAEESHTFAALMAGDYTNSFTGGTRMFMPMAVADPVNVQMLLATDAVDFFLCTDFDLKTETTGKNKVQMTVEFQGRDPLEEAA